MDASPRQKKRSSSPYLIHSEDNNKQKKRTKTWLEPPKEQLYQNMAKQLGVRCHSKASHDRRIKRKTGFDTEEDLLSFIFIACNGDIERIKGKTKGSTLTWYEDWFCFFEKCGAEPTADGLMHLVRETDLESSPKLSLQSLITNSQHYFPVWRVGLSLHHLMKTKSLPVRI